MDFTPSTTESAIEAIVSEGKQFKQNETKNWKRIKKFIPMKDRAFDLRIFQNRITNQIVTVLSSDDEYTYMYCDNGEPVFAEVFDCDWDKPKKKQFPVVLQNGCSGRMVFSIDEDQEEDDVISFCCGPEDRGHLCDHSFGWEDDTLKELFGSRLNLHEAESCHSINRKIGESEDETIAFIKEALMDAGAIEF